MPEPVIQQIGQSLEIAGIVSKDDLTARLNQARARANLSEEEALRIAVAENRAVRQQRRA